MKDKFTKRGLIVSVLLTLLFLTISLGVLGFYFYQNIFPFKSVNFQQIDNGTVKIAVETAIPAKSKVEYGTSDIYFNTTEATESFLNQNEIYVNGLLPNKTHYFRVVAVDESGKEYKSRLFVL